MRRLSVALPVAALLAFVPSTEAGPSAKTVKIAAAASPWTVVGRRVGISGSVTPHPAGLEVTLQQRHGTGWLPLGDRSVRPDGAFSFVARPDKVGLAIYRVVTSKGTDFTGSSDRVPVRVLHWTYLDSSEEFTYLVPIVGDLNRGPAASSGVRYEHAVSLDAGCYNAWGGSAWIDYPLQRRYETFTASVALGGAATSGSTATYSVIGGDGKQLASGSLVFGGAAQKIRASVSGEYRLRLRINVPDPTNAGACSTSYTQVVFGDAELLGP